MNENNIQKILIIEVAGIGDVVMSVPAIRALRNRFPDAYIAMLVSPRAEDILKGCPYIDELFTFDSSLLKTVTDSLKVVEMFSSVNTMVKLRNKKFDLALNLYQIATDSGEKKMKFLISMINAKKTVGRLTDGRGDFYDQGISDSFFNSVHETDKKMEVVQLAGAGSEDKSLELWIDNDTNNFVDDLFEKNNIAESDIIVGISPSSNQQAKLWIDERFVQITDSIARGYPNIKILFFGSPSESEKIGGILSKAEADVIDLSGCITLKQCIAILSRLNVLISVDSGPVHIASVYKIPTIVLLGPGQVKKFGPYLNENAIVLVKDVHCSPCAKMICEDQKCMKEISAQDVIDAFDILMNKIRISR